MNQEDRKVMTKLEWGVVFSVLASAASILFSAGVVWTTVQVHEREIAALKASRDETTDRLARIETKLDILLEGKRR
jgi:hypothetical protein